jgi:hypothetical protein
MYIMLSEEIESFDDFGEKTVGINLSAIVDSPLTNYDRHLWVCGKKKGQMFELGFTNDELITLSKMISKDN